MSNTKGKFNTASGYDTLARNRTGDYNTATGARALLSNTSGGFNTATGVDALHSNTTGNSNTAQGLTALLYNTTGTQNTATGAGALLNNTTGNSNIAVGISAGANLTTGNNNIDIGNVGLPAESDKIRIGSGVQKAAFIAGISGVTVPNGVGVIMNPQGQLGTVVSSARFKEAIKPMANSSEAIFNLQPVTFRYKHDLDPECIPQFGLVAEEVEKVSSDLVARDEQGKPYSVRYEAVNAMLLNELLKEHRKVQELEANDAAQHKEIKALAAAVKEQAAQIQNLSTQLEPEQVRAENGFEQSVNSSEADEVLGNPR